jgi:2OG-Fe(II) oxygenase superfamily
MDNRFIWIEEESLDADFCQHLIQKYELESFKSLATTIGGYSNVLKATEVNITNLDSWKSEDEHLFLKLNSSLDQYRVFLKQNLNIDFTADMLVDSGYKITRYDGDNKDYFDWHHDYCSDDSYGKGASRFISYIWYLNDVDGGETQFIDGYKITPTVGKLVFFPSTWTYIHRGNTPPPGTQKYICTGFLYAQSNPYINNLQKTE